MKMNHETISMRMARDNVNHHLWNNNGTWFICYTVHDDAAFTKRRIRASLGTKSDAEARHRRDAILRVN